MVQDQRHRAFDLAPTLRQRAEQQLQRRRRLLLSPQQPQLLVDDSRALLAFCSNDYLGLANHPQVIESFQRAVNTWGVGSGASHLVVGHAQPHHLLEEELAEFLGRSRALLFSTGYMANLGAVNCLLGRKDAVFEDRLNHASLLDAGLLSGARFRRYPHAGTEVLEQQLAASQAPRNLVVSDGVFSMDGDCAPIAELVQVCQRQQAWLMIDDAHGIGCVGDAGRGSVAGQGFDEQQVPLLMGTLGKALGTFGAFVAGSDELIETLIQLARTYIYTTALPPAVAEATRTSLRLLQEETWRQDRLQQLIQQFRQGARQLGLKLMPSQTAIQPIVVGDNGAALAMSEALEQRGILVTAIRPPTVPKGSARLRVTLSAAHQPEHVEQLLSALAEVQRALALDQRSGKQEG